MVIEFYVPVKHKPAKYTPEGMRGKLLTFPGKPLKVKVVDGVTITDTRRFGPELDKAIKALDILFRT
jgi:hypothetical protein